MKIDLLFNFLLNSASVSDFWVVLVFTSQLFTWTNEDCVDLFSLDSFKCVGARVIVIVWTKHTAFFYHVQKNWNDDKQKKSCIRVLLISLPVMFWGLVVTRSCTTVEVHVWKNVQKAFSPQNNLSSQLNPDKRHIIYVILIWDVVFSSDFISPEAFHLELCSPCLWSLCLTTQV